MGYTKRACPTIVHGHKQVGLPYDEHRYASWTEARFAVLLIQHKVRFIPHKVFRCVDRQGRPFNYEVDFYFPNPTKICGIPYTLDAAEIKGCVQKKDILRNEALKFTHNVRCWLITEQWLSLWENEGLFWLKEDFGGVSKREAEERAKREVNSSSTRPASGVPQRVVQGSKGGRQNQGAKHGVPKRHG